jgi:hypothetical protein
MFMMSFFEVPNGVLKNLDHFRSRFFGKVLLLSTNIGLPNGTSCVAPKIRVALDFEPTATKQVPIGKVVSEPFEH